MATPNPPQASAAARETPQPEQIATIALDAVAKAIARLRYGSIGLTVHDGRVVQLEVTERQRFT
ncbi:YezD family protein [Novosphingobium piscinae]|uniref:YezD family protein n=1 Tax=Novosphingobium piscinae TaxID=1507448 RepID=A0A7X1FW08_9SPHN|nr:YezD family protein [Novosphingobium piscinae]MBC2668029.1 YezD family protein [Novosphingobium piscinae]